MRLIRMDQLMCKHEWVLIERPRHIKYDYDGCEVVIGKCRCTKCKKIKDNLKDDSELPDYFVKENVVLMLLPMH